MSSLMLIKYGSNRADFPGKIKVAGVACFMDTRVAICDVPLSSCRYNLVMSGISTYVRCTSGVMFDIN